ncbi:MAG: hypothetical protein ACM3Y9_00565 [Ignavibacteria bacterium]
MAAHKKAVIDDMDAFLAWLSTMPLIQAVGERRIQHDGAAQGAKLPPKAGVDRELAEALKSMA